ncbi:hypothetical protein BH23ACT5_BH23ACT5_09020 [soil metagenome]
MAHRLGLTHTAAGVACVGVTLAVMLERTGVGGTGAMIGLGWAILALTVVATLHLDGVPQQAHAALAIAAAAHLVAVWVMAWASVDPPVAMPGPAPGGKVIPATLLPVYPAVALVTGLAVLILWRRHREGPLRVALVAPSLLLAASGVVNAFGAGMIIRLADLLGTPVMDSEREGVILSTQPLIIYADSIGDTAVVTVAALVVLVAVGVITWLRAGQGPGCETLADRYADRGGLDCSDPDDRAWAARVGRAESVASLTDQAAAVVGTVVMVVLVATALAVLSASDPVGMRLGSFAERLARPASVVLGLIPLVAIYLISRMYRSQPARRMVGIVWDVATFWPRWFHPWSPPAYGERAVPQLRDRLSVLTERGTVVVSGHSQGSVLAVATLLVANDHTVGRTALLTHGSPLSRLYARYFPEYFAGGLYEILADSTRGWVNLWRPTDFIGGQVEVAEVTDVEVVDPPSSRPSSTGEARPLPARHSYYDRTDEYTSVLADLVGRLT